MKSTVRIGSRGSHLALWQTETTAAQLRTLHPNVSFTVEIIDTIGDKITDRPLEAINDKGLFTKELEWALAENRIDVAVHSLKDMQSRLPELLMLVAVTERLHPEDALIASAGTTIESLPHGATVATGSVRRRAQLLAMRPDLNIIDVRGNVPTRLKWYREQQIDGMILAAAGLMRLGLEHEIAQIISTDKMIPAVGQGALGIECRYGDDEVIWMVKKLQHDMTRACTDAERALLYTLEGGCSVPIGANATIVHSAIHLTALVVSTDGKRFLKDTIVGPIAQADELGQALGARMLRNGARDILAQ